MESMDVFGECGYNNRQKVNGDVQNNKKEVLI
jgi:hypothetical protein